MIRPHIPVRDGIRPQKTLRPRWLPEAGATEYRAGFWLGYTAGLCWGGILVGIGCAVMWPAKSPYTPVYEEPAHLLVGWCGGPAPKSIPQQRADVDVTWSPECSK